MADASTVLTALDRLLADVLGSKLSAADQAKITLYSGIAGSLLNTALPALSGTINWSGIEAGMAQALAGIDATYTAIAGASPTTTASTEVTANS